MTRLTSIPLVLILAAGIHADFHLARPRHHHWSFGWEQHWLFAIVLFALGAAYVARRWPGVRWKAGLWNLALALVVGQLVEPLGEAIVFEHRLGFDVDAARWTIFWQCIAAGVPAYLLVLWLMGSRGSRRPAQVGSPQTS